MPFDNAHQTPFGDLELLVDARGRICNPYKWTKGRFENGDRHCLVAALSLAAESHNYNRPELNDGSLTFSPSSFHRESYSSRG